MAIRGFVKRFAAAERFGAYCSIVEEGRAEAGDDITIDSRPEHGVSVVDVARVYYSGDPVEANRIYEITGRPDHLAHLG
jgi:MOSC domain-containing protein YiiM